MDKSDYLQDEHEDFHEEYLEDEKPSLLKKIFLISIALFLIFLIIFYIFLTPSIRNIIVGIFESDTVENNVIEINSSNYIIFTADTFGILKEVNNQDPELEFKACLKGTILDGDYYIDEVFIPKTFDQKYNSVTAEPCPPESLVSLHSHPLKRCIPSEVDLKNYEKFKQKNPDALLAIMCEPNRFNIIS
tara:strand:+ start:5787 stop:6353 length:567 start_codon:yes stop_codon:yes gene_type:complete